MDQRIRTKSALSFLMSVITVLIFIFFYLFYAYHLFVVDIMALEVQERLERIYPKFFERTERHYRIIGEQLLDEKAKEWIRSNNRRALLADMKPHFDLLKSQDPDLDIMHFHTKDNHSLLRLHRPEHFGDNLAQERPLIAKVNRERKPASTIEVGRYGMGYRVAIPVLEGEEILGVLEFGIRLEAFSRMLAEEFGVQSAVLAKGEKMRFFYENNPDHALHIRDINGYKFYEGFKNLIESESDWKQVQSSYLYKEVKREDGEYSHHIIFQGIELRDFWGEEIGVLIVDKNIDYYMKQASMVKTISLILGAVLWMMVLIILWRGYDRYTKRAKQYEEKLLMKNRSLEQLSFFDHLTQIANRRNLEQRIQDAIEESYLSKERFSVVIFDIDNFKKVNDTYGHNVGDEVLKQVATLAKEAIRGGDVAGRWGGEEFVLWLPRADAEVACNVAERLRQKIASHRFDPRFKVTCSFGVSEFVSGMSFDYLISKADEALYAAKERGKNQTVLAAHDVRG